jgi:hypothetical protein
MNDIRQLFDAAIGVAPPSTIDIDALIRRQRKMTLVRRWGRITGAATAVVGVAVAGTLGFAGGGFQPTPEPEKPPGVVERYNRPTADRFGKALRSALDNELPGTSYRPGQRGEPFEFWPQAGVGYLTEFVLVDSSGVGAFAMTVWPGGPDGRQTGLTRCEKHTNQDGWADYVIECKATTGPDGVRIVALTTDDRNRDKDDPDRAKSHQVYVTKADGTRIEIHSRNWCVGPQGCLQPGKNPGTPEPSRPDVPITIEQMVRVALHPDISLPAARTGTRNLPKYNEPTARRLEDAFRDAVNRELPDAEFTAKRPAKPFRFRREDVRSYLSYLIIRDGHGVGGIMVVVTPETVPTRCDQDVDQAGLAPRRVSCRESTGPDGEKVVAVVSRNNRSGQDRILTYTVFVTKKDGTAVSMWASNFAERGSRPEPTRPDPPISTEAMIRVGLHPGITLRR